MLIDTHCHLDAPEFDPDRAAVIARARAAGVQAWVIPAVARHNFSQVRDLAQATPGAGYALGIHPLFVAQADEADLEALDQALEAAREDPKLLAIGEIGLDYYVAEHATPERRARQVHFYVQQLDLAQRHRLPVVLHVRRSQDDLLKHLRRRPPIGGIAHAFNGSFQQAEHFLSLGFALGMGGAMTFERARRIRRLASHLPLSAFVLETDAPDIPPAWLAHPPGVERRQRARNEPAQVAGIARAFAELRGIDRAQLIAQCAQNACRVLPRLRDLLTEDSPRKKG